VLVNAGHVMQELNDVVKGCQTQKGVTISTLFSLVHPFTPGPLLQLKSKQVSLPMFVIGLGGAWAQSLATIKLDVHGTRGVCSNNGLILFEQQLILPLFERLID
jgi:hypothetical protein